MCSMKGSISFHFMDGFYHKLFFMSTFIFFDLKNFLWWNLSGFHQKIDSASIDFMSTFYQTSFRLSTKILKNFLIRFLIKIGSVFKDHWRKFPSNYEHIVSRVQFHVNRKMKPLQKIFCRGLVACCIRMYQIIYYRLKKWTVEYFVFALPHPAGVPCLKSLYQLPFE